MSEHIIYCSKCNYCETESQYCQASKSDLHWLRNKSDGRQVHICTNCANNIKEVKDK